MARIAAAGAVSGAMLFSGAAPARALSNNPDPELSAIEQPLLDARTTDTKIYFLHRKELPESFWDEYNTGDAQRSTMLAELLQNKYPDMGLGADHLDTLRDHIKKDLSPAAFPAWNRRGENACVITGIDAELDDSFLRHGNSRAGFLDNISYHSPFSPKEKQLIFGMHELAHCEYQKDKVFKPVMFSHGAENFQQQAYEKWLSETYSDMRGAAKAIAEGYRDAAIKLADTRAVYSFSEGFSLANREAHTYNQQISLFDGVNYYSSPLLREMDREIRAIGYQKFSDMPQKEKDEFVMDILMRDDDRNWQRHQEIASLLTQDDVQQYIRDLQAQQSAGDADAGRRLDILREYKNDVRDSEARLTRGLTNLSYNADAGRLPARPGSSSRTEVAAGYSSGAPASPERPGGEPVSGAARAEPRRNSTPSP